ncbi:MAG: hypothetical protein GYA45_11625 [Pelolinea sp.]|nr:hypothetical protein [Pelolinea sp.]
MITIENKVHVQGIVQLSTFTPGVIPLLIGQGLSLPEAIRMARGLGYQRNHIEVPNLVTTVGKQFISRRITGEETVALKYMAIGTGTTAPAVTDTKLVTESMRKLLTECVQGDNFFYSSAFLLASECAIHIKEGGLFGGSTALAAADSGWLLCRFLLDFDNSSDPQDVTIQHTGEVS